MRVQISESAIETYIHNVRREASPERAEQAILEAVLRAVAADKHLALPRGEPAKLRCPALPPSTLRLVVMVIRHREQLDVIETLPPREGWDARQRERCTCGHTRRVHGPRRTGTDRDGVHIGGAGVCHEIGCKCATFSAIGADK